MAWRQRAGHLEVEAGFADEAKVRTFHNPTAGEGIARRADVLATPISA